MKLTGNVTVDRPLEHVFLLYGALDRVGEYLEGFARIRETEGELGVGTRWQAIDRWPGRAVEFTIEMMEWDPFESMATTWSEPMNGGWRATFAAAGDSATRIEMDLEMSPSGLMGVVAPLAKPWADRQTQKFLTSFKEWAEAQPAVGTD